MMDTLVTRQSPVRILLEMRPALDGHAGIPQQTRLLFRGLSLLRDVSVAGLLQSSTHALGKGLPVSGRTWWGKLSTDRQIDRLSRIVIMTEQKFLRSYVNAVPMALRKLLGGSEELGRFDPCLFRDFIWRRLFAPSLPPEDFDTVTRAAFRVARVPWSSMHICALVARQFGCTLFPQLDTSDFDVMIAETPYPATVSKRTRLVIRYHDAIPQLMPHTISDRRHHQGFHYHALRRNVASGAWFVCVSEATRKDLLSIFPQAESRSTTIHNMISHDYFDEPSSCSRVPEIIRTRLNSKIRQSVNRSAMQTLFDVGTTERPPEYLLMVSTIEPRKNHLTLLSAWERLRVQRAPGLKLVVVGSLGWHQRTIVRKLSSWLERGEAFMLADVPSAELRLLYKHASATICPSLAEGFDLSGVESMMSGGVVVASDIPVHREIYANAAEFFNPYSVEDLDRAIEEVIGRGRAGRRSELVCLGAKVAQRYTSDTILPKWLDLLYSGRLVRA